MIKSDLLVQYNHNWQVFDKDGIVLSTVNGTQCFQGLRYYFKNLTKQGCKVVITSKKDLIVYNIEEIEKYIELLNKIGIFKIEFEMKDDICNFILYYGDYGNEMKFITATMAIRYLWENHKTDVFYKIPGYFIKLAEKYPNEDLLYLFLWSQCYISDPDMAIPNYNSNHSMICISTGSSLFTYDDNKKIQTKYFYPFKLKDLKWDSYSINTTFTNTTKREYNKQAEAYKQELKDFKLFE